MSVKIQPLADYVVAQQEEAQTKTNSGLYLPDNAQEKPKIAKILAIGKKVEDIKVGDRVIYGGYGNEPAPYDGDDYVLIKAENIYAVIK